MMSQKKRTSRLLRFSIILGIAITVTVVWFAAVEKSWYIEGCSDCVYRANVMRYRVFGHTIYETTEEHNTLIRTVLDDLGVPCQHNAQFSHYKCKYYGLIFKVIKGKGEEEETGMLAGNSSWYTEEIAQKVRKIGNDNPEFAKEFYKQILEEQNYEFWRNLFLKAELGVNNDDPEKQYGPFHGRWVSDQGQLCYSITHFANNLPIINTPSDNTWKIRIENIRIENNSLCFDQYYYTPPKDKLITEQNPSGDHPLNGIRNDTKLSFDAGKPDRLVFTGKANTAHNAVRGILYRQQ